MTLHHLSVQRWTDPGNLAPVLQLSIEESRQAVERLLDHRRAERAVRHEIDGVPESASVPSIALSADGADELSALRRAAGVASRDLPREQIARSYARARGRVSTTELGSIVGAARTNVGSVLRGLERQGELAPSRENRRGPGFFYHYTGAETNEAQ